jgi:hypothetical protein
VLSDALDAHADASTDDHQSAAVTDADVSANISAVETSRRLAWDPPNAE